MKKYEINVTGTSGSTVWYNGIMRVFPSPDEDVLISIQNTFSWENIRDMLSEGAVFAKNLGNNTWEVGFHFKDVTYIEEVE